MDTAFYLFEYLIHVVLVHDANAEGQNADHFLDEMDMLWNGLSPQEKILVNDICERLKKV